MYLHITIFAGMAFQADTVLVVIGIKPTGLCIARSMKHMLQWSKQILIGETDCTDITT